MHVFCKGWIFTVSDLQTGPRRHSCTMRTLLSIGLHTLLLLYVRLMLSKDSLASLKEINQEKWERDIRSAASLDELLMLTDFPDWKLWRCRLKLKHFDSLPEFKSASAGSHRSTRFAANSYSLEILKAIDEEWQKTQCMPRETCVDVAKELGTTTAMFFKPPCVSVFRCSGCCNKEGVTCRNTSTTYVNKTLLSVIPFEYGPEPMLVKVANHTECKCQEPQLIRRHARPHSSGCIPIRQSGDSRRLCDQGLIWDCLEGRCVPYPSSNQAARHSKGKCR
ncbi:vascular endothelial growth factor D isoform X3 [Astyanax mexicanus]|uniref:vascular endothelial growth factor D isoform X3 n=1 Tax=Astyanax mexicanus TaxID=7994 RepID=UPI000BBDB58C|nr:vascular endothelial growth factor D isoform X3 [Astyanax mexicanus]